MPTKNLKEEITFLPSEKIRLYLDPVRMFIYWGIFGTLYRQKKIIVTNKRIIISFSIFGLESFSPHLSYYYRKSDYQKYKQWGTSLLLQHQIGRGTLLGKYIKLTAQKWFTVHIKIYTPKNKEIATIIRTNSS